MRSLTSAGAFSPDNMDAFQGAEGSPAWRDNAFLDSPMVPSWRLGDAEDNGADVSYKSAGSKVMTVVPSSTISSVALLDVCFTGSASRGFVWKWVHTCCQRLTTYFWRTSAVSIGTRLKVASSCLLLRTFLDYFCIRPEQSGCDAPTNVCGKRVTCSQR